MTTEVRLGAHDLAAIVSAAAAMAHVGVLDAIVSASDGDGAAHERDLVTKTGCDPIALDRVLAVLAAVGVVDRDGHGSVRLGHDVRHECATVPHGLRGVVALFAHAPRFLATGARLGAMDGDLATRAAAYAPCVSDLGRFFEAGARALATRLPPARAILDLGAGSGVWSLAMAEAAHAAGVAARATAIDFAPVLPAFHARAASCGLAAFVDAVAGSYLEAPLSDASFDRVVLANVLHLEPEPRAAELVARAARACAPGGCVIVVDVFPLGPRGPLAHAAYELHLAMRTASGRAHAVDATRAWLTTAGLVVAEPFELEAQRVGLGALVAEKPRADR